MIPRPRLLWLFSVGLAPLVAGVWMPELTALGLLYNVTLVALAVVDLLLTPPSERVEIERAFADALSVGSANTVELRLRNRGSRPMVVEVTDEAPTPSRTRGLPARLVLPPARLRTVVYRVLPQERGLGRFGAVHLRHASTLGLWTLHERRDRPAAARIYPDIGAVGRFDLLAVRNRLDDAGLKFYRIRGRGGDFERLREYRREDELRDVDWKATAKHEKLISREFTVERNQNIFILLDSGRSMINEAGGLSHLDRGLNAAIILGYIALGQGDNVGLMAFSNRVERYVRPLRGKTAVQAILRQTYDLQPRRVASDYGHACEEVLRRQRKRALLILITHALDEQHLVMIERYVRSLTSHHLLLLVFLRDLSLVESATRVPSGDLEAFQAAASAELIVAQAQKIAELRESGVLVLETRPDRLSSDLINEYLALKARHLL